MMTRIKTIFNFRCIQMSLNLRILLNARPEIAAFHIPFCMGTTLNDRIGLFTIHAFANQRQ
jgi:hypothetical protein